MSIKADKIWMDGELVNFEDATVHVLTHTLHYGLGAFEGIRCYKRADGPTGARQRVWVGVILVAVVLAILMGWIPVPGIRAGASLLS